MLTAACAWGAGTTLRKSQMENISSFIGRLAASHWRFANHHYCIFIDAGSWEPVSTAACIFNYFCPGISIILCWFAWFTIVDQVPVAVSTVSILAVPALGVGSSVLVLGSHRLAGDCLASPDLHCYRAVVQKPDKSAKTYSD